MLSTFNTAIVSKAAFDAAEGATDQKKSAAIFAATSADGRSCAGSLSAVTAKGSGHICTTCSCPR
jgi:hypothetical protein